MNNQFLNIVNNEIKIPGLKQNYTILQISDTHIMAANESSTPEHMKSIQEQEITWLRIKKDFANHFKEPWNEEHNISTIECFEKVMEYAKKQAPDLLILSGDILNFEHKEGYEYFVEYMKSYPYSWLFVPGNHDNEYMPRQLSIEEMQIYNFEEFRVVGLDNSKMTVTQETLEQLEGLLSDGKPTILVMHVPVETNFNKDAMGVFEPYFVINIDRADENGRRLIEICENKELPIVAVLCGHVHGYHKSELIDGREQICCSSGLVGFVHQIVVKK